MRSDPAAARVIGLVALLRLLDPERRRGRRVVFTNGCFDLLHAGHVELLEQAAAHGDILVVGVNSDASVRRLKGPGRPLVAEADRVRLLAALRPVDWVVLFEEDTPRELIDALLPDVLVKGADYAPEAIVGRETVEAHGGQVVRVHLLCGRSSTALRARLAGGDDEDDPEL